jgi:tight adherence protein B
MIWIIVGMFAMSSYLLFSGVLQLFFMSNKRMEKRLNRFLELNDKKQLNRKKFTI